MNKKEIREVLGIPKDQRIAQFIYNQCRSYEETMELNMYQDGKFTEKNIRGIDIFHVEDTEFIKLLKDN